MTIQATLGFATDLGRGGAWDEVYYANYDTPQQCADAWQATTGLLGLAATSVLGSRLSALSSECFMYYARFSTIDVTPRLASILVRGNAVGFRGSENFASDAAGFQVFGNNGQVKRNVRMAGLPDNVVQDNAINVGFIQSYILGPNGFIQRYANQGNGVIRFRSATLGGSQSYNIVGATQSVQYGLIVLTMKQATSGVWSVGQLVDLSTRGNPQLRGRWKISNVSVDTLSITLAGSNRVSAPLNLQGLLTPYDPNTTSINVGTLSAPLPPSIVQLTPHKLGKKKYQPRGRRSPILLRH